MKYFPLTTNTLSKADINLATRVIKSGNITKGKYNRLVEKYCIEMGVNIYCLT